MLGAHLMHLRVRIKCVCVCFFIEYKMVVAVWLLVGLCRVETLCFVGKLCLWVSVSGDLDITVVAAAV